MGVPLSSSTLVLSSWREVRSGGDDETHLCLLFGGFQTFLVLYKLFFHKKVVLDTVKFEKSQLAASVWPDCDDDVRCNGRYGSHPLAIWR